MEQYRVLLVDDEEEIRRGISKKIDWGSLGFQLVGEAGNGAEALELSEQLLPDLVLTDIKMPYMDGLELCQRLKHTLPAAKLIIFSGFDDFEYARQAIQSNVSEYILKPINAQELAAVLQRLKLQLDHQRQERLNAEMLLKKYEEALPTLRELFYTRLIEGGIPPEQIAERGERYGITFPDGVWTAAMLRLNKIPEQTNQDSILLSLREFIKENFEMENSQIHSVLYHDAVVLLIYWKEGNRQYRLVEELERLCALSENLLGTHITVGLGLSCGLVKDIHTSIDGAKAALDYCALTDSRIICIADLEPLRTDICTIEDFDQHALIHAVKIGTEEQIYEEIHKLGEYFRSSHLSLSQYQMFLLEAMVALIHVARSGGIEGEVLFGENFTGMVSIHDFRSLDDLMGWMTEHFLKLHKLLSHQRRDSAWKTIDRAKTYILEHYGDCTISVEQLCSHLQLSPAYFSTLFKKEMGMSFIQYLTSVRMEHAADLLRHTDEKTYLIAEKTGYTDPNYFSYVFKRHYGKTPSKFRASQSP